jgi:2-oxoglutarate ferredoxin oxidoreductase subunit alpha
MPTKREQSDLFAAVFSAHGYSVRPVLAPTTVADSFDVTVEAFNIAEEYQTPVILLSDQELAQRKEIVAPIDTSRFRIVHRREPTKDELVDYHRFRFTDSGISPLSDPGMPGGNYRIQDKKVTPPPRARTSYLRSIARGFSVAQW